MFTLKIKEWARLDSNQGPRDYESLRAYRSIPASLWRGVQRGLESAARWRKAAPLLLLAGCAGAVSVDRTALVGPIDITWHRVGYFELQKVCGTHASPLAQFDSKAAQGCAIIRGRTCTIYTLPDTFEATVGHEMLHCFMAIDPRS